MLTTIDKSGRIKIHQEFWDHLGIKSKTKLKISEYNQRIFIEPIKEGIPVVDRDGILVFTGKLEKDGDSLISADRNRVKRKLLGDIDRDL